MVTATLHAERQALDRLSARAGGELSRAVLAHSPVVFGCRYAPEDMVVLDLIGRYRLPVRVITWDVGLPPAEGALLRAFLAKRYVFAAPVTHVRDDRLAGGAADALDWLAIAFTGSRCWISTMCGAGAVATPTRADEPACVAPIAGWTCRDVQAYVDLWDLASRPR